MSTIIRLIRSRNAMKIERMYRQTLGNPIFITKCSSEFCKVVGEMTNGHLSQRIRRKNIATIILTVK